MPRKPIIYSQVDPYHIRIRSNNRNWFDLRMEVCFQAFTHVLKKTIDKYSIQVHAFVMMNNHVHMIISTPSGNISQAMRYFMTESARKLRVKSRRINHVFGGRYKWTLLDNADYYAICLKYIYRNPVRAKISATVESYAWSSLSRELSPLQELIVRPVNGHDAHLVYDLEKLLGWLNEPTAKDLEEATQKALKRSKFTIKTNRRTQRVPDIKMGLPSWS